MARTWTRRRRRFWDWLWDLINPPPTPPEPPVVPAPPSGKADELREEINKVRMENGLNPLIDDACLSEQARLHCVDMDIQGSLNHDGFGRRLEECGKRSGGENVAYGYETAERCVTAWWNSPGHHRNIVGNWRVIGTGFHDNYWTAIFSE